MNRIIILTQYFLPEMGAPQNRLYDMSKGLIKLGWEVSVVTAMPNYPTGKIFKSHQKRIIQTDWVDEIEVRRYWLYPSNSPNVVPRILSMISFTITSLFSLFYIRSKKPTYLLVESPPLTLAFSGWILSRLSSSKLILNISDLWPLSAKELGVIRNGRIYRVLERLEEFLYRKAFLCTGQSQEIVDYISKTVPDKVYLFRNGMDASRFKLDSYNVSNRNKIVYGGLLGVAQGILSICEHIDFKKLKVEFHIYGTGAEQERIVSFLQANPHRGIFYHGTLNRNEMPQILNSYGGTLIPLVKNIYGAVPSKIYEALAAGLPVIFSGEGEGAAIIKRIGGGWINQPGNWSGLEKCIEEFRSLDDQQYYALRQNNRQASQQFDRNHQIAALNSFICERINSHG